MKVLVSKITAEIGNHCSTIYREARRNAFKDDELNYLNGDYGMVAHRQRRSGARTRKLIRLDALRKHVTVSRA